MGWASAYIAQLAKGSVSFCPHGHSMEPVIKSGQLCTVKPATAAEVEVGDVVLCKVNGREYLHLVKAKGPDGRVLIGNNRGHTNGWTRCVFGVLVKKA